MLGTILGLALPLLGGILGSKGGQATQTSTFEPAPRTPEQSRIADQFINMLLGGGGSAGLLNMLTEDQGYMKDASADALSSSSGIADKYLGNLGDFLTKYIQGITPSIEKNKYAADMNRAIYKDTMFGPVANRNRAIAQSAPITLSMDGFSTPFTTGTQREAKDYYLKNIGTGIDLADQLLRTQDQSQQFYRDILDEQQATSGQRYGLQQGLIDKWLADMLTYTPNAPNLQFFDILNNAYQSEEGRRYGAGTSTQTADTGGGIMDALIGSLLGAKAGTTLGPLVDKGIQGLFNRFSGSLGGV